MTKSLYCIIFRKPQRAMVVVGLWEVLRWSHATVNWLLGCFQNSARPVPRDGAPRHSVVWPGVVPTHPAWIYELSTKNAISTLKYV